MKFAVALCLLLATSGFALMPKHPADLVTMLTRQQFAMRQMMAAPQPRAVDANDCFNSYLNQQTNVIMNYNKEYTGCLNTAEADRVKLTEESASEREDLINRTDNMCTSLTSCDKLRDGLDFFECYRDASSDSYKTMFTLNSDSNLDYNHISASYSVIETALTTCVDEARYTYAQEMDSCDESLTVCLNGGAAPTDAPVSTDAPATSAAPVTTDAPAVSTEAPAVSTEAPAVTTEAPAVSTEAPAVSTEAPAVTTEAPAVSTEAPAVTTEAPAVSTEAPAVSTEAPGTTAAPATSAAPVTTEAPAVTTEAPAVTTEAPINTAEPTTERAPEEDLGRSLPGAQKGIWNLLKRYV